MIHQVNVEMIYQVNVDMIYQVNVRMLSYDGFKRESPNKIYNWNFVETSHSGEILYGEWKNEIKNEVTILVFEIMQRHLYACVCLF